MNTGASIVRLATAWADANCTEPKLRRDFVRDISRALQGNTDLSLAVGWKLTKSRKPYLVYVFARHFFAFTLTNRQAKDMGVDAHGMKGTIIASSIPTPAVTDFPFEIHQMEIDNCRYLDGSAAITGRLQFERHSPFSERVAVLLEMNLGDRAMKRFYIYPRDPLVKTSGEIELKFAPIRDANDIGFNSWHGVTGAFCRFVTVCDPAAGVESRPLSHAFGVMLDVLPDASAPGTRSSRLR